MDTKDELESFLEILEKMMPPQKERSEFDKKRQEANLALAGILVKLVQKHPSQRFSQILRNYGFVRETRPVKPDSHWVDWKNEFSEEPWTILERVKRRVEDIDGQSSNTEAGSGASGDDNS